MNTASGPFEAGESGWRRAAFGLLVATAFSIAFSIALGQALLVACFLAAGVAWIRERRVPALPPIAWFAAAFVLYALGTAVLGPDSRGIGKGALRLLWFAAIPLTAGLVRDGRRLVLLLRGFALGTGVLVLKVLVWTPWRAWDPSRSAQENFVACGSMTAAQMLMMGVLVTMGFLLAQRTEGRSAWGWAALLMLEVLALVVSFKRGAWISAGVMLLVLLLLQRQWRLLGIGVAVALLLLAHPWVRQRMDQLHQELRDRGGRVTMWTRIAPTLVRAHPWGIGYAALTNERMRQIAPETERQRDHLHSNPVQIVVETGWPGLALYLLWMLAGLRMAGRLGARFRGGGAAESFCALAVLLMLGGLLLNGLVEYNFGDTELILVYALLFGVLTVRHADGVR